MKNGTPNGWSNADGVGVVAGRDDPVTALHRGVGLWQVQAPMLDDLLIIGVWLSVVCRVPRRRTGRASSVLHRPRLGGARRVRVPRRRILRRDALRRRGLHRRRQLPRMEALRAGIGWAGAAIIGLVATRHARPLSRGETWILGIDAVLSVVAAVAVTRWYFSPDSWGEDMGVLSPTEQPLALLYQLVWLDGAIVAAICLALILRNRRRGLAEQDGSR